MQKRINWTDIFTFYLSADTISLKNCAAKFQISYDVVRQQASKEKWRQDKKKSRLVARRMVEIHISKNIAEINEKHVQFGQWLQAGGIETLKKGILPTNARDAQGWIKVGVAIERKALGMNQTTQPKIETTSKASKEKLLEDGTQNKEE